MAVRFLEPGTDATQDFTFWQGGTDATGTGATLTSATDQAHTGTRSIKSFLGSATSSDAIAWTGNGFIADSGTCLSMWCRFAALPTVTKTAFLQLSDFGFNNNIIDIGLTTAGNLAVGSEGVGILGTGTGVIAAATWTRISVSYVITGAANYTIKIYINGVLDQTITQTAGTLVHTGTSVIVVGGCPDNSAGFPGSDANFTVWMDDIYVDDRSDLTDCGDIRVTAKRPFSNGTANNFTTQIGAGGSGYGSGHAPQVNEQPLSQTNGWSILVVASALTEEYNIEGLSVGDVDLTGAPIKGVQGWIFAKSSITEADQIIVDGTATTLSVTSTPTLFIQNSPNPTTYPAGTGTDIGMKTNATAATASLYECGVLVAYNLAVTTHTYVPPVLGSRVREGQQQFRTTARYAQGLNFNPAQDQSTAQPQPVTYVPPVLLDPYLSGAQRQYQSRVGQFSPLLWFVTVDPATSVAIPDTYQPPIQGPSALSRASSQYTTRAIATSIHLLWSSPHDQSGPLGPQPGTAALWPMPGEGAYNESLAGLANRAMFSSFLLWGGGGDLPPAVPDTYIQPIQGAQRFAQAAQQYTQRVAQMPLLWTVPIDPVSAQPDTYSQPVQGTDSLAKLARQFQLTNRIGTVLLWNLPQDQSTAQAQPDTYVQPIQGLGSLGTFSRAYTLTAGRLNPFLWFTPEDSSSIVPDSYISPIAGLGQAARAGFDFSSRSRMQSWLLWNPAKDQSTQLTQPDTYVPPISGLGAIGQANSRYGVQARIGLNLGFLRFPQDVTGPAPPPAPKLDEVHRLDGLLGLIITSNPSLGGLNFGS